MSDKQLSIDSLFIDIRSLVNSARRQAAQAINVSMVALYWQIGERIKHEVLGNERATYGKKIIATLSQQLSWSHFVEIVVIDEPLQRDFYTELCRAEGWSVRELRAKIKGMLFERTAISRKPEELIRSELTDVLRAKLHKAIVIAQEKISRLTDGT